MDGLSDMALKSQIVTKTSSAEYHNLCVARSGGLSHIVNMDDGDKNGGPVTLKAWRKSIKGMTLAALADAAGTNSNMIGYLEKGERALTVDWMRRLAPHLNARPGDLIDTMPGQPDPLPSVEELARMIQRARDEMPADVTYADFPQAVASGLRAQLMRYRASGGYRNDEGEGTPPDTGAPPPRPTMKRGRAGPRSP